MRSSYEMTQSRPQTGGQTCQRAQKPTRVWPGSTSWDTTGTVGVRGRGRSQGPGRGQSSQQMSQTSSADEGEEQESCGFGGGASAPRKGQNMPPGPLHKEGDHRWQQNKEWTHGHWSGFTGSDNSMRAHCLSSVEMAQGGRQGRHSQWEWR